MALQNVKMVGLHRCEHARHIRQHAHLDGEVVKVVRAAKATQDVRQTLPARVIEVEAARGRRRGICGGCRCSAAAAGRSRRRRWICIGLWRAP